MDIITLTSTNLFDDCRLDCLILISNNADWPCSWRWHSCFPRWKCSYCRFYCTLHRVLLFSAFPITFFFLLLNRFLLVRYWINIDVYLLLFQVQVRVSFPWNQRCSDSRWQSCRTTLQACFSTGVSSVAFIRWFALEGCSFVRALHHHRLKINSNMFDSFDVLILTRSWNWWQVAPFPLFELQSKWIAGVLSNRIALPSEEEMVKDIEDFYMSLEASGTPKSHTHNMSKNLAQVPYYFAVL